MGSKNWDGILYRFGVTEQSDPELYLELSSLNSKARVARLKSLAMIGLFALKGKGLSNDGDGVPDAIKPTEESTKPLEPLLASPQAAKEHKEEKPISPIKTNEGNVNAEWLKQKVLGSMPN